MIKVFTTNKNGKIELTKDELKSLLDEAYWDGYSANTGITYTYRSPSFTPYWWTATGGSITVNSANTANSTINAATASSPNSVCEAH